MSEKSTLQMTVELTVEGDTMKGTVASGDRQGQVVVKKRKE